MIYFRDSLSLARHLSISLLLVIVASAARLAEAGEVRIAAAASLHHALPEIVEAFRQQRGHVSKLIFGASGNLARQIAQVAATHIRRYHDDHGRPGYSAIPWN